MIVRSNAMTYGTTAGGMRMLELTSRETKEKKREGISNLTPGHPGCRIYSLSSPAYDANFEEKCFSTFINIYTKQTCGFLLENLSIKTSFGKKRVKKGKMKQSMSPRCPFS